MISMYPHIKVVTLHLADTTMAIAHRRDMVMIVKHVRTSYIATTKSAEWFLLKLTLKIYIILWII